MKEQTPRELLLTWKESSIMERRAIEGQMRARAMPIRLPTEEAIVYALIDWLEDVEKRLAKRPKPKARKKAKAKAKTNGVSPPLLIHAPARQDDSLASPLVPDEAA